MYTMSRPVRLVFVLMAVLSLEVAVVQAAEPAAGSTATAAVTSRPRVGLVLAGGGAKGAAHVGVLKVLEEMHVPIDCIAGTSMGALVGAGYASGISSGDMTTFLLGIDWQTVVGGLGQRSMEPIEQKHQGVTYSNSLELGIKEGGVTMASGLVNTSGIENLLRGFVAPARSQTDFNQFAIPYRAVATDMVTGKMVVMDHGDLATAMRASMAIPGAFAPVLLEGQVLADGGLVRNIPVDVARNLCADVVIVVNLVEPPATAENMRSPAQLLGRTMDVMIEANEALQLQSIRPEDVRIDVEMGDIGTADFERVDEAIPLGEVAARKYAPQLARFSVPADQYTAWRARVTAVPGTEFRIADVQFSGLSRVNPAYLEQRTHIHGGDVVSIADISTEAQRLSALQELDAVSYELKGDPANPTLVWLPQEKNWGPDFLKVDVGLHTSAASDDSFLFYLQHTRTWVNGLGAQWRNELQLGTDKLLSSSFYQPLDISQRFFIEPKLFVTDTRQDLYDDGERLARYRFNDIGGRLDFGMNLGSYSQIRAGYSYVSRDLRLDTGPQLLPEEEQKDAGFTISAIHDSRDTPFNPTRGLAAALEYARADDSLGGDRDWQRAELGLGLSIPLRNDVLWVNAAGGTDFNSGLPADRMFVLGGPLSFPGQDVAELRASSYWTMSTGYLWKMKDIFTLRGQSLYAGLRLQGGQVFDRFDGLPDDDIESASVYITGRTPVGPLTVGYAASTADSWSLWLSIGRPLGTGTILERGIFR
jgi:NTE family protein